MADTYQVPAELYKALGERLAKGPASTAVLEGLIEAAGLDWEDAARITDQWLDRQRRAGAVTFDYVQRQWVSAGRFQDQRQRERSA